MKQRQSVDYKEKGMSKQKRIIICVLVILSGFVGMAALSSMKKVPAEVVPEEKPLMVETMKVSLIDEPVFITAYGQAKAACTIPVASEVPGKIIRIHPRLENGNQIKKDELLFEIDPQDYEIIIRSGTERRDILQQIAALAEKEYLRKKLLFENDQLSTRSGMDNAEKAWLSAAEELNRLNQAISTAEMNLKRCRVIAPCDARVSDTRIEKGQYVSPGQVLVSLVDDSQLEVQVALDSRDARQWLQFNDPDSHTPWFSGLKNVPCSLYWTENPEGKAHTGTLDRVIRFDDKTRTLTLAIKVCPSLSGMSDFPLVDGMFCKVTIPGKTMNHVMKVPQWAVSSENTVNMAENNRLKTVPVNLVRSEGDVCYITGDIKSGDTLICTRLFNPLENNLISIIDRTHPEEIK